MVRKRTLIVAVVTSVLVAACASTSTPVADQRSTPATTGDVAAPTSTTATQQPRSSDPVGANDLVTMLSTSADLEVLMELLAETGLRDRLRSSGPYTVIAPNNDAFEQLPYGLLDQLRAEPGMATLARMLEYHVIRGLVPAEDLTAGTSPTLAGTEITPEAMDAYVIDAGGEILVSDVPASNGTFHVVNRLLVPPYED